jgi:uncharacterized membrane protein YqaE (UPF0057 family)
MTVIEAVLAFFLPPVAVALKKGWFSGPFWLDVVLTLLGHIPGVIYALVVTTAES